MDIHIREHPLLDAGILETTFSAPLAQIDSSALLSDWLSPGKASPLVVPGTVKKAVRDLLRVGGFKPAGRSKPASEYLLKAVEGGFLSSINGAVDICNIVSFHSGLPISVVDLDRVRAPYSIGHCPPETHYVFNLSGQEIRLDGLVAFHDKDGPSACAVKDSQRSKTGPETLRTLSVIWGTHALKNYTQEVAHWYQELSEALGATCQNLRS